MLCPGCDTEIEDPAPACPNCGAEFADPDAKATRPLDVAGTARIEDAGPATTKIPLVHRIRIDLVTAAGFSFLALVCSGAVLALAGKLQYPELGSAADPVSTLTAVVMVGLAVLGASVHVGELTVSASPLGALLVIGGAGAWSTARAVRSAGVKEPASAIRWGASVAIPFALMCWLAALIFRIRGGPTPISIDGTSIVVFSLMWGAVFGIVGGWWAVGPRKVWRLWKTSIDEGRAWIVDALVLGGWVMGGFGILGAGALLLWIIGASMGGGPATDLGFAGLLAALLYVLAFGPNLIVAVTAISLGAPVRIGAAITRRGRAIGDLHDHSLFEWPGGVHWWLYLLVLIPLTISVAAGFHVARTRPDRLFPHRFFLLTAAVVALALFVLAGIADARLGAGLVRNKGVALAAPSEWATGALAFVWIMAGTSAGWLIHRRRYGHRLGEGS